MPDLVQLKRRIVHTGSTPGSQSSRSSVTDDHAGDHRAKVAGSTWTDPAKGVVVVRFPSMEVARSWYVSDDGGLKPAAGRMPEIRETHEL